MASAELEILLNPRNTDRYLKSLAGKSSSFKEPNWQSIYGHQYDLNLIQDLFDRPIVVKEIEKLVKKNAVNVSGDILQGFELSESKHSSGLPAIDEARTILIERKVTILRGNRLYSVRKSNIPFINFFHFF